jgi:hypothetical protein
MNKDIHLLFEAYQKAQAEKPNHELAQGVKKHLRKIFGDDYNETKASHEAKKIAGVEDEERGHDPAEVAEYDKAREEISFHKYPFWDAYHAVKEGAWTEEDFHQWCQTVWNDGAESAHTRHPENEEVPGADDACDMGIEGDGSIQPGVA